MPKRVEVDLLAPLPPKSVPAEDPAERPLVAEPIERIRPPRPDRPRPVPAASAVTEPTEAAAMPKPLPEDNVLEAMVITLPWVISVVVHVALAVIAFFVGVYILSANPSADDERLDILVPNAVLVGDPGGVRNPGVGNQDDPLGQDRFRVPDADGVASDDSTGVALYRTSDDGRGRGVGPATGGGIGAGNEGRTIGLGGGGGKAGRSGPLAPFGPPSGGKDGPPASFFGSGGNAYRIVYIPDRTGSMLANGFDQVQNELKASIAKLKPQQDFAVLFLSRAQPLEPADPKLRGLIPATPANKQAISAFIDRVIPEGQTDPLSAFERAFALRNAKNDGPQLIYLLSDAAEEDIFKELRDKLTQRLNRERSVKINTIAFVSDASRAQLIAIAKDNGGQYRFVSADELDR